MVFEDNKPKEVTLTSNNFTDEQVHTIIGMIDQWLSMYPGKVQDYDIEINIKVNNIKWEKENE